MQLQVEVRREGGKGCGKTAYLAPGVLGGELEAQGQDAPRGRPPIARPVALTLTRGVVSPLGPFGRVEEGCESSSKGKGGSR